MGQGVFDLLITTQKRREALAQRRPDDPMQVRINRLGPAKGGQRLLAARDDPQGRIDQGSIKVNQQCRLSRHCLPLPEVTNADAAIASQPPIISTPPDGAAIGNSRVPR